MYAFAPMDFESILSFVSWYLMVALAPLLMLVSMKAQQRFQEHHAPQKDDKDVFEGDDRPKSDEVVQDELPDHAHVQSCFIPFSGELMTCPNTENRTYSYENDMASGSVMMLHRATWDSALNRSGEYPQGYRFKGNKLNWEMRMQMRFKKAPEGTLKFGLELDDYVPLMAATKASMKAVVSAMKWIVGDDLHHSVGDDPSKIDGEAERPIFSMPIWASDQVIETPEGEDAPDLTHPDFANLGIKRSAPDFAGKMKNMDFKVGPTYTFCFWSISPLMDNINWTIGGVIPGVRVDYNQFCGRPPVHIVVYTLKDAPDGREDDERHLDSRKSYAFHMALWSSIHPPSNDRLQQLVPGKFDDNGQIPSVKKSSAKSSLTAQQSIGLQGAALRSSAHNREQRLKSSSLGCFQGLLSSSCFPKVGR
jgi:hypothetical protein